MQAKSLLLFTAVSTLLSLGATTVQAADAQEKCYGIAKAGQNGCAANGHSCAGQSKVDKDPGEWKKMTQSECTVLGGSPTPGQKPS